MKKIMLLLTITAAVFAAQAVLGDVKVVNHAVTTMNDEEQSSGDMTAYYTEEKLRMEDPQGKITIIRLDKGLMWSIDPEAKTYTEQSVEDMAKQLEGLPEEMMEVELDVEKTGEKEKIGKYDCTKFILTMTMMGTPVTTEVWATTDIQIDPVMLKFAENANKAFEKVPMLQRTFGMFKEVFDANSFPVKTVTETDMFGMKTKNSMMLKSISSEKFADSLFEIPEGYKKQTMRGFGGKM